MVLPSGTVTFLGQPHGIAHVEARRAPDPSGGFPESGEAVRELANAARIEQVGL